MNWLIKFADDTNLDAKIQSEQDRIGLQRDLDNLEAWSTKWQMPFNVEKCKVMHFGTSNKCSDYTMNNLKLNIIQEKVDLGISLNHNLKPSNQCIEAKNKAPKLLGMINRTIKYKNKKIMLSLYKALVRPVLEYCAPAWSPYYARDKNSH